MDCLFTRYLSKFSFHAIARDADLYTRVRLSAGMLVWRGQSSIFGPYRLQYKRLKW